MFGFPKVTHKIFKNNFLKTAIFQIRYSELELTLDHFEKIEELFKASLPRIVKRKEKNFKLNLNSNAKIEQNTPELGYYFELKSLNGLKKISIAGDTLDFTISGDEYAGFKSIDQDLNNIIDLLSILGVKEVLRVAIRKINILEFDSLESTADMLRYVITENLLGYLDEFPLGKHLKHSMQSIVMHNEENLTSLYLRYGFNVVPIVGNEKNQIVVDIDIFKNAEIKNADILTVFNLNNIEIFNTFNWVINEKILNILNE